MLFDPFGRPTGFRIVQAVHVIVPPDAGEIHGTTTSPERLDLLRAAGVTGHELTLPDSDGLNALLTHSGYSSEPNTALK